MGVDLDENDVRGRCGGDVDFDIWVTRADELIMLAVNISVPRIQQVYTHARARFAWCNRINSELCINKVYVTNVRCTATRSVTDP